MMQANAASWGPSRGHASSSANDSIDRDCGWSNRSGDTPLPLGHRVAHLERPGETPMTPPQLPRTSPAVSASPPPTVAACSRTAASTGLPDRVGDLVAKAYPRVASGCHQQGNRGQNRDRDGAKECPDKQPYDSRKPSGFRRLLDHCGASACRRAHIATGRDLVFYFVELHDQVGLLASKLGEQPAPLFLPSADSDSSLPDASQSRRSHAAVAESARPVHLCGR